MSDPYYSTPEGDMQIIYVWHLHSGCPLFALPPGDYHKLNTTQPERVLLTLGKVFTNYLFFLPTLAWMLTGERDSPVQFLDGHTGGTLGIIP